MNYRPEIDGLRAVAVVPVILFHAGFSTFAGGFVGVDVFFVISGYLITSIILGDLAKGRFSIVTFYERRARRILPALFTVMLACVPFALMWMSPARLEDFGKSLVAVTLFVSNVLFWKQDDYFAPAAEQIPLLHTWSLAVEEQYYLLFPLFLAALWRFGRAPAFYGVLVIAVLSLALNEWALRDTRISSSAVFYLSPTRAWELMIGSICAFWGAQKARPTHDLLAALGAGLIVISVFAYDKTIPFPSVYALAPVLGTALIVLFATSGTLTARFLANRVFVGIGLISFSAYLWHQPLFAFARIRTLGEPSTGLMLSLAALSIGLAVLSWRFIEQPFRTSPVPLLPTRPRLFGASALGGLVFVALGAVAISGNGLPGRLTPAQASYIASTTASPMRAKCHTSGHSYLHPDKACSYLSGPARVAVFGDSHAVELAYALAEDLQNDGIAVRHLSFSLCSPQYESERFSTPCAAWTQDALTSLAEDADVTHVVVTHRITKYLRDADAKGHADLADGLRRILEQLSKTKTVAYVVQAPELPASFENIAMKTAAIPDADLSGPDLVEWSEMRAVFDRLFLPVLAPYAVIDAADAFCVEDTCVAGAGGVAYYFDQNHPSMAGADLIARLVLDHPAFANLARD
ncbi:acyltransferase family protein [Arenibacterium sp. CAU 1754]